MMVGCHVQASGVVAMVDMLVSRQRCFWGWLQLTC